MISYKKFLESKKNTIYRIYRIFHPDLITNDEEIHLSKSYIGMTERFSTKFNEIEEEVELGKTMANGIPRPIVSAFKKFGREHFEIEILDEVTGFEKAAKKEKNNIKKYNTLTPNGYNISKGGDLPDYVDFLSYMRSL